MCLKIGYHGRVWTYIDAGQTGVSNQEALLAKIAAAQRQVVESI